MIFVLLRARDAGRLGAGRAEPREPAGARRRRLALVCAAGDLLRAARLDARRRHAAAEQLGPALKVAWGFADPPTLRPASRPAPTTVGDDPAQRAAAVAAARRCGAGAGRRAARAVPRPGCGGLSAVAAFVGAGRRGAGRRPLPGEHGLQPGDPGRPRNAARPPAPSATCSRARRTASRASNRPGIDQPLQPDLAMRYGLYDARGYDYPVERRYDTLLARDGRAARGLHPAHRAGPTRREACAALSLLSVTDLLQDPADALLRAARPAPRLLRAPTRASTATRTPCRASSSSSASARSSATATRRSRPPRTPPSTPATWPSRRPRRRPSARRRRRGRASGRARPAWSATATSASSPAPAARRSLLVLTDVYYPGLEGDGRRPRRRRSSASTTCCAAWPCPPGGTRVEFRYEPASWRVGWIVSAARQRSCAGRAGRRSAARRGAERPLSERAGQRSGSARPTLAAALFYAVDIAALPGARRCCRARRCRTPTRCGSSRRG